MLWVILAFMTALFESMKDVFSKKSLLKQDINEYEVAWGLRFFALPILLVALMFEGVPNIGEGFLFALAVNAGLNAFATILYMKAIKYSDISLTVPMVTFTPLFLLATSPLILGEFPGFYGVIGIAMIVGGSYILNIRKMSDGLVAPMRALLNERGPRLMLAVAFIWSITAVYDKVGVLNSSPVFWVFSVNLILAIVMFPVMVWFSGKRGMPAPKRMVYLLPVGVFTALTMVCQMTAMTMALVAYVISIKRMSAVMSVGWGGVLFNEKNGRERVLGSMVMVLGVVMITVF